MTPAQIPKSPILPPADTYTYTASSKTGTSADGREEIGAPSRSSESQRSEVVSNRRSSSLASVEVELTEEIDTPSKGSAYQRSGFPYMVLNSQSALPALAEIEIPEKAGTLSLSRPRIGVFGLKGTGCDSKECLTFL
jgi:hypothetical protein